MVKPKIRIVACADNFHFIKDLVPALSDEFDIKGVKFDGLNTSDSWFTPRWHAAMESDIVWIEWADGEMFQILAHCPETFGNKKIILRLHRYELFTPRTLQGIAALSKESIERIDKLVFVSKTVQQIGIGKFPWMSDSVVIPNLIDHTKFPFHGREKGLNIMMLGRMSYVKNLPLALSMFHELWKKDSRYNLHLVGNISDPELVYYIENFVMKAANPNIYYHGQIDNDKLPKFMENMNYILSSSVFESQGMGILEAMCCGLKPLVFNFPGALDTFPMQCLWIDLEQFRRSITYSHGSEFYHNWVVAKYSIEKNIYLYKNLIYGVLNETKKKEGDKANLL